MKRRDLPSAAIALLAFAAYVVLSVWILYHGNLHEDAYILLAYAENLAAGDGIVYFQGGAPTEGATDFLWMVSLALMMFFGVDAGVSAALLNGLGIGLIAYLMVWNLRWEKDTWGKLIAGAAFTLLLLTSKITLASASGFSTALYVGISTLIAQVYMRGSASHALIIPWLSVLLGLVRPDGVIIGAAASFIGLGRVWGSSHRTRYLFNIAGAALVGVVYFAWRFNYFGQLLPLPLYVKSHGDSLLPGLGENVNYLTSHAVLFMTAILALVTVSNEKRFLTAFVPVIALLASLTFAHQSQNIANRFQAPVTGMLYVALALFLGDFLRAAPAWKRRSIVGFAVAAMVAGIGLGPGSYLSLREKTYIQSFPFLARDLLDEDVTIALSEAGRMAYWNDAKTVDLVGLNTAEVAVEMLSVDYLAGVDPDVIFVHTAGTLTSFKGSAGNTLEVSQGFIDEHTRKEVAWQDVSQPVKRAPHVVYAHLRAAPDRYNIVFARLGDDFHHLYAVKKDGAVDWTEFKATLDASFETSSERSYMDMKRELGH